MSGNVLFRKGDYAGAVEAYSAALTRHPGDAAALGNRAAALLQLGDASAAETDASRPVTRAGAGGGGDGGGGAGLAMPAAALEAAAGLAARALIQVSVDGGVLFAPLVGGAAVAELGGRRLHSSTFRLNVSAFDGIGGAFRGCLGGV